MLFALLVRLRGGFWAYRELVVGTPEGRLKRVRAVVYKQYLEHFGSYISLLATFDGPPTFPHKPMGVFIAPMARIGKDAVIYQQVTIGKNDLETSRGFGSPTIGDGVYIGAGAKIIGNVVVGDGARVAAGAIVVKDVPAGATARSPAAITG